MGVNVISTGVGGITESDVSLAKASSAVVIGFNVRPAGKAQQLAEQEGVDIKLYQVIYDAIDDVKKAMVGMLAPIMREKLLGKAEVRQVFNIPKAGTIAGCFVTDGKITRKAQLRLVRDSVVIYTGKVGSLRRFKDDVCEVAQGYECGLSIEGYDDLKEGDVIEAFEVEIGGADAREPGRRRQAVLATTGRDGRYCARHAFPGREPLAQGQADGAAPGEGSGAQQVQRVDRRGGGERSSGSGRCWGCRWSAAIGASRSRRWTRCCASSAGRPRSPTRRGSCRSFGDELAGPDFKHWEE